MHLNLLDYGREPDYIRQPDIGPVESNWSQQKWDNQKWVFT